LGLELIVSAEYMHRLIRFTLLKRPITSISIAIAAELTNISAASIK
jgi:hypothetical protein